MFLISAAVRNTLEILKISFKIVCNHPSLVMLIFLQLSVLYSSMYLYFMLELYCFGVWIIDFSTFHKVMSFSVVRHLLQVLLGCGWLVWMEFVSISISYIATFRVLTYLKSKAVEDRSLYTSYKYSFKELVRHALIMTCEHLKGFFSWFFVTSHLTALQDVFDGSYDTVVNKYQQPLTVLLYPLLIEFPGRILKRIRYDALELLQSKYSKKAEKHYKFASVSFFFILLIWLSMYVLHGYKLIKPSSALLISIMLTMIYVSVIRILITIFEAAVYYYCKEGQQPFYDQSLMDEVFKVKEPDTVLFTEK